MDRCFDCFFEVVNYCFHLQLGTVHVADQLRRVLMRFQLRHQLPWNYSMRPRRELLKFDRSVSSCFALSCSAFSTLSSSLLVFASCSASTTEVDENACSFFRCCRDVIEELEVVAADVVDVRLSLHRCRVWSCHSLSRHRHAILREIWIPTSSQAALPRLHPPLTLAALLPFVGPISWSIFRDSHGRRRSCAACSRTSPESSSWISAHDCCAFVEE